MSKKVVTDDGEIIDAPVASKWSGPMFFKTPWNHDTDEVARQTGLECKDPTKCQQNLAEEQEMQTILKKFFQNGMVEQTLRPMQYMEVPEETDLLSNIVTTAEVEAAWAALPAAARNMLHDPQTFAAYMNQIDEDSIADLKAMGLMKEPPPEIPEPPKPPTPPVGTPATGPAAPAPTGAPVT